MALLDSTATMLFPALVSVALATLSYMVFLYISRIYFSPISHIPGPKLAAATRWYEFYYDAVKNGKYYLEVEKMHKQYGTSLETGVLQ
jgi:hypothetical protein